MILRVYQFSSLQFQNWSHTNQGGPWQTQTIQMLRLWFCLFEKSRSTNSRVSRTSTNHVFLRNLWTLFSSKSRFAVPHVRQSYKFQSTINTDYVLLKCPWTDLNKRYLPRPKTTTLWKTIKNWNPPHWVPLKRFFKNWY